MIDQILSKKKLLNMGFKEDCLNGFILNLKRNHYIRVYIDLTYNNKFILNIRASKYTREFKPYNDLNKATTFIKKLKKRLEND